MRKFVLGISALMVSVNTFATTDLSHQIDSAVSSAILKTDSNNGKRLPLIYGGKDISRAKIASADASVWTGQQNLAG